MVEEIDKLLELIKKLGTAYKTGKIELKEFNTHFHDAVDYLSKMPMGYVVGISMERYEQFGETHD